MERQCISVEELRSVPLISWKAPNYLRYITEASCRDRGFRPNISMVVDSFPLALKMAELGVGYCVVASCAADLGFVRLSSSPINELYLTWTLGISREQSDRPAVKAMAEQIRYRASRLVSEGRWVAETSQ